MSAATATNGKPQRKQLADEIDRIDKQLSDRLDRFDTILDTLAEGLNEAVADAAREGTRLAVKDAIVEILSNAELRALLVPQSVPTPTTADPSREPRKPSVWDRVKARVAAARAAVAGVATKAKEAIIRRCVIAGEAVVALGRMTGESLPMRKIVLVGLGVGLVVGATCLIVPQTAAAVVSGVGAACTSIAVQTGNWLTRAARRAGVLS